MNVPKEELKFVKEIFRKIAEYADEKKDYGIITRISISLIRASMVCFIKRKNFIELSKIALQVAELFNEINEIDFPGGIY